MAVLGETLTGKTDNRQKKCREAPRGRKKIGKVLIKRYSGAIVRSREHQQTVYKQIDRSRYHQRAI